jgi:DNA-binding transcriptional LysR family regulator
MLTITGLVAAGIGVSPVPASVGRLRLGGVTYGPLTGAPRSELVGIARADHDSPLVQAFIEHAEE